MARLLAVVPWLAGCAQAPAQSAYLLARHPEAAVELDLPRTSRATALAGALPLAGPFALEATADDAHPYDRWTARLPFTWVDPGFNRITPPEGFELHQPDPAAWRWCIDQPGCWIARGTSLALLTAPGSPAPDGSALSVSYHPADAQERSFNLDTSGQDPKAFAFRSAVVATEGGVGLLLPAPAAVAWDVDVPVGAVLSFETQILRGAVVDGAGSDGAIVEVEIERDGVVVERRNRRVAAQQPWVKVAIGLDRFAGQRVRLRLRTLPAGDAIQDYVFVRDPAVYVPTRSPRHVVLVFADTLRRDHLGLYGYTERPTTPGLDAWSEKAVVFDDARTVAPWTLPTARALLSGFQPEQWGHVPTLPRRLAADGFATAAFFANAFLTPEFEMSGDWGRYDFDFLSPANDQVDQALAFLAGNDDRDAAVLVHFMDTHLPWREPLPYSGMWAGEPPIPKLAGSFSRTELTAIPTHGAQRDAARAYLLARYDQNVAWLDHELSRLLSNIGDDATAVVFADHGEEFWDHGGLEHGHALWDELVRVPLMIRAPGLAPDRVDAPVSLLDVPGTLLELLGIAAPDLADTSLVDAMLGDPAALARLRDRPVGFGRTLRGEEAWGMVSGGEKWLITGGTHRIFDLAADPGERRARAIPNGPDLGARSRQLGRALGMPIRAVVRALGCGTDKLWSTAGVLTIGIPGGFARAWPATSTRETEPVLVSSADGPAVSIGPAPDDELPRESYLLPNDATRDLAGLWARYEVDGRVFEARREAGTPFVDGAALVLGPPECRVKLGWDWSPEPPEGWHGADTHLIDGSASDELRELGYVDAP